MPNYLKYKDKLLEAHGTKYDYSKTVFKTREDKIDVICPLHGVFTIVLNSHLKGTPTSGCKICNFYATTRAKIDLHFQGRIDHSNIELVFTESGKVNASTITGLVCIEHNHTFSQSHQTLTKGHDGCLECRKENRKTPEPTQDWFAHFEQRAQSKFNSKYKYFRDDYKGNHTDTKIECPVHGIFTQKPHNHLSSPVGCPKCVERPMDTQEDFLRKAREVHGDRYDYSETVYVRSSEKVTILCREHGPFKQGTTNHYLGEGCPACGYISVREKRRLSDEEVLTNLKAFIPECEVVLPLKYENNQSQITLECPTHGLFSKTYKSLSLGTKCPGCTPASQPEMDIMAFIKEVDPSINIIHNARPDWMGGKELDIYLPDLKLAIEYNGSTFHHSSKNLDNHYSHFYVEDKYHYNKWATCYQNGVTLLSIYDFYWLNEEKQAKYKSKIKHYLGKDKKVFARKCVVTSQIDNSKAYQFYDAHHLEGRGFSYKDSKSYALYYEDEMVMCATVGEYYDQSSKTFKTKLHRICTVSGITVVGGISKLYAAIKADYESVVYSITLSSGGSTPNLDLSSVTLRYFWVKPGGCDFHHRNYCQKGLLEKHFGVPLLEDDTETSYMQRLGYVKVYDNGVVTVNI